MCVGLYGHVEPADLPVLHYYGKSVRKLSHKLNVAYRAHRENAVVANALKYRSLVSERLSIPSGLSSHLTMFSRSEGSIGRA